MGRYRRVVLWNAAGSGRRGQVGDQSLLSAHNQYLHNQVNWTDAKQMQLFDPTHEEENW
jgi:hypothetical protein